MTSVFASPRFLRHVLVADAASCVATGAAQLLFTDALAGALRLPVPLLAATGVFLLAYAALVGWTATRDTIPRGPVGFFIVGNFAWALGCIALLAGPWVAPGPLGQAWVLAQAACAVVLAELQWMGLRRSPAAGWA